MSPRAAHLALLLLSASVSLLLALRSRRVPALRAAAVACWVFVGLDVGRFAIGLLSPLPAWLAFADVLAFVLMPGCWGALLQVRHDDARDGGDPERDHETAAGHDDADVPALKPVLLRPFSVKSILERGAALGRRRGRLGHTLRVTTPGALALLYAAALLALRHQPGVAERWEAWLAAPRLCVGAMALWVVLRWRSAVVPGVEPPDERLGGERKNLGSEEGVNAHAPGVGDGDGHVGGKVVPFGERTAAGKEGASLGGVGAARGQPGPEGLDREGVVGSHARHGGAPPPLAQPSRLIGVVMGLGCAACVVGGLWGAWWQVQILAAVAWALTALVAWKA